MMLLMAPALHICSFLYVDVDYCLFCPHFNWPYVYSFYITIFDFFLSNLEIFCLTILHCSRLPFIVPSGATELIPVFSAVCVVRFLVFYLVFCRLLFVILFVFYSIGYVVLSVFLELTDSDCPFGIFKLV